MLCEASQEAAPCVAATEPSREIPEHWRTERLLPVWLFLLSSDRTEDKCFEVGRKHLPGFVIWIRSTEKATSIIELKPEFPLLDGSGRDPAVKNA